MKRLKQDKEMISAYLDGELSPGDKSYIEGKISASLELQKELSDLKRLKELTSTSYERIPESPYFQTRLTSNLSNFRPFSIKLKHWAPALGLTIITITLMVVLKLNPDLIKNVIEEQKMNLASLYKENLQPLLYAADLTNEDIFNFAFNSELPLDKSDQHYLRLGYDPNGTEYFEIKKSTSQTSGKENNLEKFVLALDLNESQRKEIDSIISSYSEDLLTQVLVSDKNTVAINPNLWNYQKAIAAEILAFAKSKNAIVYNNFIPSQSSRHFEDFQVAQYVKNIKPSKESKYIFFTPDTIFTDTYEFNDSTFRMDLKKMEKEIAEMNKNIKSMTFQIRIDTTFSKLGKDSAWAKDFTVQIDTDKFKVKIPNIVMEKFDIPMPDMDSINVLVRDALKQVQVHMNRIPGEKNIKHKFKVEVNTGDSLNTRSFNFNGSSIDSIMKKGLMNLDSLKKFNFETFDFFGDSTSGGFNFFLNDSLIFNQNKELRRQMEELKEEMRKFRHEMRNLQIDPPSRPDSVAPKLKGIDI